MVYKFRCNISYQFCLDLSFSRYYCSENVHLKGQIQECGKLAQSRAYAVQLQDSAIPDGQSFA